MKVVDVNEKGGIEWITKMILRRFEFLLKQILRARSAEDKAITVHRQGSK